MVGSRAAGGKLSMAGSVRKQHYTRTKAWLAAGGGRRAMDNMYRAVGNGH